MGQPFFNKHKNRWYVRIGGKQINLGAEEAEARTRFKALSGKGGQQFSVSEIIDTFLRDCEQAPGTRKLYAHWLNSFRDSLEPGLLCADLKHWHVHRWVKKSWSDTTANCAIRCVARAFSWAAKLGHVEANPLVKIERPTASSRECDLTQDQLSRVCLAADEDLGTLIEVMAQTGCRPQEARRIEARHLVGKTVTFPRAESKGKKCQRVIVLTELAYGTLRRLALKYPTGPLLRVGGEAWTSGVLASRFNRLAKKLGFEVSAYHIRHKYCTDALERGVDPVTVSTLMGHSDMKMVWSVYQHIQKRSGHMQQAAELAIKVG